MLAPLTEIAVPLQTDEQGMSNKRTQEERQEAAVERAAGEQTPDELADGEDTAPEQADAEQAPQQQANGEDASEAAEQQAPSVPQDAQVPGSPPGGEPSGFWVSEPKGVRDPDSINTLLAQTFPRRLMIQTHSACNSDCLFCPHSQFREALPQGKMKDSLFREIVQQASQFSERIWINLFLMNEPLLDRRIVERVELVKRQIPRSVVGIWTNGAALNEELIERLMDSPLDGLGVSLHAHTAESYERITGRSDFDQIRANVVRLARQRLAKGRKDLTMVLRFVGAGHLLEIDERMDLVEFWAEHDVRLDILVGHNSRAGLVTSRVGVMQPRRWLAGCGDPDGGPRQAHILFNGQVVLCCMDYQRSVVLGDLTVESLEQIWNGPRRREVLRTMYGLRQAEPGFICSACEWSVPVRRKKRKR